MILGISLEVCQTHQGHFWTFQGKTKTKQDTENMSDIEERIIVGTMA